MTATVGSLCSGIGGLELGVDAAVGTRTVWQVEVDPHASAVLAARWPGVPNLGDLTAIDWEGIGRTMDKRRKDALAQAMYDRYCQGLSLAEVGTEFGRTRQSVYGMFADRGWSMRARPPARPTVEFTGRRFSLRNSGYYGATDGDRELLHRIVWEHHKGPIPDGWDVHHHDHDKTNNDITNLRCLPKAEHTRHHHAEAKGVMPEIAPVDLLTAGYPRVVPAVQSSGATNGRA